MCIYCQDDKSDALLAACTSRNCLAMICIRCALLPQAKLVNGQVESRCPMRCVNARPTVRAFDRAFYTGIEKFDERCSFPDCKFETKDCFKFMKHVENHFNEAPEVLLIYKSFVRANNLLYQICFSCFEVIDGDNISTHDQQCKTYNEPVEEQTARDA